jgi:hypothetical protein
MLAVVTATPECCGQNQNENLMKQSLFHFTIFFTFRAVECTVEGRLHYMKAPAALNVDWATTVRAL